MIAAKEISEHLASVPSVVAEAGPPLYSQTILMDINWFKNPPPIYSLLQTYLGDGYYVLESSPEKVVCACIHTATKCQILPDTKENYEKGVQQHMAFMESAKEEGSIRPLNNLKTADV